MHTSHRLGYSLIVVVMREFTDPLGLDPAAPAVREAGRAAWQFIERPIGPRGRRLGAPSLRADVVARETSHAMPICAANRTHADVQEVAHAIAVSRLGELVSAPGEN